MGVRHRMMGCASLVAVVWVCAAAVSPVRDGAATAGVDAVATSQSADEVVRYYFIDTEDRRTLAVIEGRADISEIDGESFATMTMSVRFTGKEIDPPRGFMFGRRENLHAARAAANGIERGWLRVDTSRTDTGEMIEAAAEWQRGNAHGYRSRDGLTGASAEGRSGFPSGVSVSQRADLSASADETATRMFMTTIRWQGDARLRIEWSATRGADGHWSAMVRRIEQPEWPESEAH